MIPYVISTVLSCFFIRLETRESVRTKKINIRVILAIFIPSILAGAGDASVGTDTYMLSLLAVMLLYNKGIAKQNSDFDFFTLLLIVYIILWQLQGISRES